MPEDTAHRSEKESNVGQEVQGHPTGECDGGQRIERSADVPESRLEAGGEKHDAGDHWQVKVAVGVARKASTIESAQVRQPSAGEDGSDIEVEPPER